MNLYQNKNFIKLLIVGLALVIGLISIIYTNSLVNQLAMQERGQIALFAKAQGLLTSISSEEANTFLFEIVEQNNSIPVILTDATSQKISNNRNIIFPKNATEEEKEKILRKELEIMKNGYEPLEVIVSEDLTQLIYYRDSPLITQLRYYPLIELLALILLGILAYVIFSTSRRSEQDRVWVGLAKETAHQLGTPISALMAWVEYFRTDPNFDLSIADEMDKDIKRLEMITARFSNIGSEPAMKVADAGTVVEGVANYLVRRISTKTKLKVVPRLSEDLSVMMNIPLFEWVIENLCKNAVDSMGGVGKIDIYIRNTSDNTRVQIDVRDTGKGIPAGKLKTVFKPGFTTKKRGWGLGLTLVKRIVEEYHKGEIFVLRSDPENGTTFRILVPKGQGKGLGQAQELRFEREEM
jgi:signal transduction histidine kinase